jgi:hypothetical protein
MADANGGTTARDDNSRRLAALRALAAGPKPEGSPAWTEAVGAFGDEEQVLLAVHQRWQSNLLARLDQVLELGGDDVHADVLRAVDELSRAMPGFADVLRHHADDPVLRRARQRLAAYVDSACPCGRQHPLVAPTSESRSSSRCIVVRRARAIASRWRSGVSAPPPGSRASRQRSAGSPPGSRLLPRRA